MKHLTDIVNEAMLPQPAVEDDKVKVIALVSKEHIDDNLDLMKGMNRVCLIWSPEDGKGYVCANGGVRWNDGKQWTSLANTFKVLGKQTWKNEGTTKIGAYAYRGQIGGTTDYDIDVYSTTVSLKDLMKMYKQNGVSLYIYKRSYATASLHQTFKEWRNKGILD